METGRKLVAVGLGLVGLAALVSPEEFAYLFLDLSPDQQLHSYSWLQLEIALAGLLGPAVVLFVWPSVVRGLRLAGDWLGQWPARQFWMALVGLGLLLRLVVIALFDPILVSDAAEYDRLGWTLAQTGCYCESGVATAYRAPGYPVFLAGAYTVLGHHPMVIPWLQIIPGMLIAPGSYLVARQVKVSESGARLLAVMLTLFPSVALYTNLLLSELLFTALLLIGLYLCLRREWWAALGGGIGLGLAVLTRPIGLAGLAVVAVVVIFRSEQKKAGLVRIGLIVVGALLLLLPWLMRNGQVVGSPTLVTSAGVNFYIGNHEQARFGYQAPDPELFQLDRPELESYHNNLGYQLGWEHIKRDPAGFFKRAVAKTIYLYAFDADPLREPLLRTDYTTGLALLGLAVFTQGWYLVFLTLVGYGLWRGLRGKTLVSLMLPLGIVLAITAIHAVYFAAGRFHLPLLPLLAIMVTPGLSGQPGQTD